jgi:transposase
VNRTKAFAEATASTDFRRIATRYDKLARNYASAVALAAIIAFWC